MFFKNKKWKNTVNYQSKVFNNLIHHKNTVLEKTGFFQLKVILILRKSTVDYEDCVYKQN